MSLHEMMGFVTAENGKIKIRNDAGKWEVRLHDE